MSPSTRRIKSMEMEMEMEMSCAFRVIYTDANYKHPVARTMQHDQSIQWINSHLLSCTLSRTGFHVSSVQTNADEVKGWIQVWKEMEFRDPERVDKLAWHYSWTTIPSLSYTSSHGYRVPVASMVVARAWVVLRNHRTETAPMLSLMRIWSV